MGDDDVDEPEYGKWARQEALNGAQLMMVGIRRKPCNGRN